LPEFLDLSFCKNENKNAFTSLSEGVDGKARLGEPSARVLVHSVGVTHQVPRVKDRMHLPCRGVTIGKHPLPVGGSHVVVAEKQFQITQNGCRRLGHPVQKHADVPWDRLGTRTSARHGNLSLHCTEEIDWAGYIANVIKSLENVEL
jgi:hypothetical protein